MLSNSTRARHYSSADVRIGTKWVGAWGNVRDILAKLGTSTNQPSHGGDPKPPIQSLPLPRHCEVSDTEAPFTCGPGGACASHLVAKVLVRVNVASLNPPEMCRALFCRVG